MKQREFLKAFSLVTLSTAMIGTATCCYIRAGLGGDSVAVFLEGVSCYWGITLGTASWLFNVVLLIAAFFTARKKLGWTTVYNSLLCGLFVDLANWALDPILGHGDGLMFRWSLFLVGLLMLGAACALMMLYCPGMSVLDAVTMAISERFRCAFRAVRIGIDLVLMAVGFALGGTVGFGTAAAVAGTGPVIQLFYQLGKKE